MNGNPSNNGTGSGGNVMQQPQQSSSAMGSSSSIASNNAVPVTNGILDNGNQDLRSLALQQHLLAAMQQQQQQQAQISQSSLLGQQSLNSAFTAQTPTGSAGTQQSPSGNNTAATLSTLYQQLISQQLQQQQQPASVAAAALPQQFNTQLHLQNVTPSVNLASHQQHSQLAGLATQSVAASSSAPAMQQPAAGTNALASALSHLAATNPALLQAALQNQALQQQQQLLALLLQNPTTASLYAYHNYLQQQQQQQSAQANPLLAALNPQQSQLGLISQLLTGNLGSTPQLNQLAGSLVAQQQQSGNATIGGHTEESKALLEQILLRQNREHQQQSLSAFPPLLSSGNSSASATNQASPATSTTIASIGRPQTATGHLVNAMDTSDSPTPSASKEAMGLSRERIGESLSANPTSSLTNFLPNQAQNVGQIFASTSRQASSDRLLSAESVQDHITRLISENEAIVEPNPVLLKRRPYHRQSTSNSITSQTSEGPGGLRDSPNLQQPKNPTTRSQSLHESSLLSSLRLGGSLSSGQPIIRHPYPNSLTCNFCQLKFPNEAGLEAHEFRCSKKEHQLKRSIEKQHSQPHFKNLPSSQLQLSHTSSSSHEQILLQIQQNKLLAQHQSNIAALVGGGMGVAPDAIHSADVIVNGAGNCGRSSVPIGAGSVTSRNQSATGSDNSPPVSEISAQQMVCTFRNAANDSPNPSENRHPLKKRLLDAVAREAENNSESTMVDVVSDQAESSTKMAKMDANLQLLQQVAHQINQTVTPKTDPETNRQETIPAELQNLILLQQVAQQHQQQLLAAQQRENAQTPTQPIQQALNQPIAGPSTSENTVQPSTAPNDPSQANSVNCPEAMHKAINTAVSYANSSNSTRVPYFLTLNEQEDLRSEGPSAPYRNRMRNITSDTFVCLNRLRPMSVPYKNKVSMYNNSCPQVIVSADEEKLASLFLNTSCDARISKMGIKDFCLYTTANRDSNGLRTTHSSFWALFNKTQIVTASNVPQPAVIIDEVSDLTTQSHKNEESDLLPEDHATLISSMPKVNQDVDPASDQKALLDVPRHKGRNGEEINRVHFSEPNLNRENSDGDGKTARLPPTMTSYLLSHVSRKSMKRTEEVDVYVRGRGRGRYVCDRCGIRCKKPSMLKKHLKSHTNIRPYTCISCSFSFKTKGNLTKHLFSKAHRRRLGDTKGYSGQSVVEGMDDRILQPAQELRDYAFEEDEGRLVVVDDDEDENQSDICEPPTSTARLLKSSEMFDDATLLKMSEMESKFVNDEYDLKMDEDDDESFSDNGDDMDEMIRDSPFICNNAITYRRFGQENILVERSTHTPPTLWMLYEEDGRVLTQWPKPDLERCCHSAPPVALCSPDTSRRTRRLSIIKRLDSTGNRPSNESREVVIGDPQTSSSSTYLLSDISPPASADYTTGNSQLIANFIPAAKPAQSLSTSTFFYPPQGVDVTGSNSLLNSFSDADLNLLQVSQPHLAALINAVSKNPIQQQIYNLSEAASSSSYGLGLSTPSSYHAPGISSTMVPDSLLTPSKERSAFTPVSSTGENSNLMHPTQLSKPDMNNMEAFLATESQEFPCEMCERKFRKESELHLHTQTHLIEQQQNARARIHQCNECKVVLKSKQLLSKHLESAHGNHNITTTNIESSERKASSTGGRTSTEPYGTTRVVNIDASSSLGFNGSNPSQTVPTIITNNSRNFLCTDCNLGFRTHGVLAKHLRSKNHIKSMVNSGKLPESALSLIKDKEQNNVLGNIDTADCEVARISLLNLLGKMGTDMAPGSNSNDRSPRSCTPRTPTGTPFTSSSLECREQLTAISPSPQINGYPSPSAKIGISDSSQIVRNNVAPHSISSPYQKPSTPLPHGLKRKSERPLSEEKDIPFGGRKRCASNSSGRLIGIETKYHCQTSTSEELGTGAHLSAPSSVKSRSHDPYSPLVTNYALVDSSASSPLHSLANIAVAAANGFPAPSQHGKTLVANVWIPPRYDHIIESHDRRVITPETNSVVMGNMTKLLLDAAAISENVMSNRSAEETSESTGRSESSTPVQRSQINGIAASPMPFATRCSLCEITFETPADLQVHFHADHVVMRDGKDFKCPRKNCDKIYPNRDSLRQHIIAHFFGGGATPTMDSAREEPIAESPSGTSLHDLEASPSHHRKSHQQVMPAAPSAPNQSPGAPEETHTTVSRSFGEITFGSSPRIKSEVKTEPMVHIRAQNNHLSFQGAPRTSGSVVALPCHLCGSNFSDAVELQKHWMERHWVTQSSAQVRPFVCRECDAGFTTEESLTAHTATHSK
ncbi:transcription factor HIVEP3 [Ditylenchus destructor]|nr:transcription factor HIVEP3 [Ditylenchus destructor]